MKPKCEHCDDYGIVSYIDSLTGAEKLRSCPEHCAVSFNPTYQEHFQLMVLKRLKKLEEQPLAIADEPARTTRPKRKRRTRGGGD